MKNLLAVIIFSVAILAGFVFVLPAYDQLKAIKQSRVERQTLLSDSNLIKDKIVLLKQEFETNKDQVKRLAIALPVSREMDYLTSSLENAATANGAQLISVAFSEPVKGSSHQSIPAAIEVSCRYQSCAQFLLSLEQSLRLYDIDKITISDSSGTANGFLKMSLSLKTYSIK